MMFSSVPNVCVLFFDMIVMHTERPCTDVRQSSIHLSLMFSNLTMEIGFCLDVKHRHPSGLAVFSKITRFTSHEWKLWKKMLLQSTRTPSLESVARLVQHWRRMRTGGSVAQRTPQNKDQMFSVTPAVNSVTHYTLDRI